MIQRKQFSSRSIQKETEKREKEQLSMMLLLTLRRIFKRNLHSNFQSVYTRSTNRSKLLARMLNIGNKNIQQNKQLYFRQLKFRTAFYKKREKLLKKIASVSAKCQIFVLCENFKKIKDFSLGKTKKYAKKLLLERDLIITNVLKIILKNKIQNGFEKIKICQQFKKNYQKNVRSFQIILRKIFHGKMKKYWKCLKPQKNAQKNQLQSEVARLQKKISQLNTQLAESKKRYEDEFKFDQHEQKKSQKGEKRLNKHQRSSSQTTIKRIQNKPSFESLGKKSETENISYGSIFNGSFTFRSGKSSRQDSLNQGQGECYCKYRQKYNHYKCQSMSLRNQVQIIKKQLELTKDLNDHLQNEFVNYLDMDEGSGELERLRKETKDLRKERDILREKVLKYQKHISQLKHEFKLKMENLYRSIKKNN